MNDEKSNSDKNSCNLIEQLINPSIIIQSPINRFITAGRICIHGMLSCGVCLSVRLSVTLVYCVETTELIFRQLALVVAY